MGEPPSVIVTGDDERSVADVAAKLRQVVDGLDVSTAEPGAIPAVASCLVADGADTCVVDSLRETHPDTPIILFADGDRDVVEAALANGATDYVQRTGSERYVVLAHRLTRLLEADGALEEDRRQEGQADVTDETSSPGTETGSTAVGVLDEQVTRREIVTQLQAISRDLMQIPSRESVGRVVSHAVETVLGCDLCVFRLYDADDKVLEPVAVSDVVVDRMGERPVYGLDDGLPGGVFASGEPAVYDDVRTIDDGHDRGAVRAAMYFPVGVHGTLSIGATTVDAFDELDREVAALIATNAAAACNRARWEREVREARERIATILDRIEGLVQDTVEVLVEATTREEVERGVCEQLAAADPYVFAWLARPDVRSEALTAREWTGEADVGVADESVRMDGETPGAVAHRTGSPKVVDVTELDDAGWLRDARDAGVESVMAIPLDYTDASYGILYVCADRANAFDQREQVVLESLGRAVANTINAIESGRILSANQVIELEFTVDDRELPFSRFSAATGAHVATASTVTQENGSLRIYLTATGADGDEVLAALDADPAVASATRVAEHEGETLFEVIVTESLLETLVDHGAVPKHVESEHGVVRYAVELPYEAEAREVFGLVDDRYERTDLVSYHEHERPVHTQQEFRAALFDTFTDRQETALRTAYLGGFFDWPREVDGDELAEGMDISRPTYHQHLRAAQQKVFQQLFDP